MEYTCASCGARYTATALLFRCRCGGYLEYPEYRVFPLSALAERDHSIWRYREAYGLPRDCKRISLGEGCSPLTRVSLPEGVMLAKLDYLQPSGSFKDRGAAVLISLLAHLGAKHVVEDSSGNAGAAVSAYAAAAGIRCSIYTPDYTPEGKLSQIRLYGGEVRTIAGTRDDAAKAAAQAAQRSCYASHLWNPAFVLGLQSTAFELWEQLGEELPSLIVLPLGSGGYIEGLQRGFEVLLHAGYIEEAPRLVGVQAERCSPVHRAFEAGAERHSEIEVSPTIAEGIAVQNPPRSAAVLKAIRDSNGYTMAVSESEIQSATEKLLQRGVFAEPTSAAAYAAWRRLSSADRAEAIVILTGHGLKQLSKLTALLG